MDNVKLLNMSVTYGTWLFRFSRYLFRIKATLVTVFIYENTPEDLSSAWHTLDRNFPRRIFL